MLQEQRLCEGRTARRRWACAGGSRSAGRVDRARSARWQTPNGPGPPCGSPATRSRASSPSNLCFRRTRAALSEGRVHCSSPNKKSCGGLAKRNVPHMHGEPCMAAAARNGGSQRSSHACCRQQTTPDNTRAPPAPHICVQLAHKGREVVVLEVHGQQVTSKLCGLPYDKAAQAGSRQGTGGGTPVTARAAAKCGADAPCTHSRAAPDINAPCCLSTRTSGRQRPMKRRGRNPDRLQAHICVRRARRNNFSKLCIQFRAKRAPASRGSRLGEEGRRCVAALLRFDGCWGVGTAPAGVHEAVAPPKREWRVRRVRACERRAGAGLSRAVCLKQHADCQRRRLAQFFARSRQSCSDCCQCRHHQGTIQSPRRAGIISDHVLGRS